MVPRLFPNSTIVCIAGGPSLTPADVEACRGRACVIAINDAIRLAPWADVLYACDPQWWRWHHGVPGFAGPRFALEGVAWRQLEPVRASLEWAREVDVLRNTGEAGLELAPDALRNGRNGGYQAINLAVHLGARAIVLLGYDMQGRSHWFGDHPIKSQDFAACVPGFETLRAPLSDLGIDVINASRESAIPTFDRLPIEVALDAANMYTRCYHGTSAISNPIGLLGATVTP